MKLLERPLRRSSALTVRTAIAGGLALLVVAVGLGMRWPNAWWRSGPGDGTQFDYSALDARFGSLRNSYVSALLGGAATRRSGVQTAAFNGAGPGSGVAITHRFTNDDFERAYNVGDLPFSARTNTTGATRQSDEPVNCFPAGGTAWYRYKAPAAVALFADTFGTPEPTSLGVYRGTSRDSLTLVGCDTNVLGNAQVGFRAAKGATYYFQLTAPARGGATVFELAAVGPTTIQSLSPSGGPADADASDHPDISGDGRYVVFGSYAHNLAPDPPDCGIEIPDVLYCISLYLRDRATGETVRIAEFNQPSGPPDGTAFGYPSFSGDGRYVGFYGYSLVSGAALGYRGTADTEQASTNVYIYDRITRHIELVSRNSAGEPARTDATTAGNPAFKGSEFPSVSADGRYVVFTSDADNLGTRKEPGEFHIYRRDRATGTTRLVSTDPSGRAMHGQNCAASGRNISGDGRYVVFKNAPDRSPDPVAGTTVYLWDARTSRSRVVSKVPAGTKPLGSYCPSISSDGSRVGLVSLDALVPQDTNHTPDVYVYEVATGRIQRISVTSDGRQTRDPNYTGREYGAFGRAVNLSADGRYAVFDSAAPDLAPTAVGGTRLTPNTTRVFLHDNATGATVLASVSSTGEPLPGDSNMPYISPDGRSISFMNLGVSGRREVMVHRLR